MNKFYLQLEDSDMIEIIWVESASCFLPNKQIQITGSLVNTKKLTLKNLVINRGIYFIRKYIDDCIATYNVESLSFINLTCNANDFYLMLKLENIAKIVEITVEPAFFLQDNNWELLELLIENPNLVKINGFTPRPDRKKWSKCVLLMIERNKQLKEVCDILNKFSNETPLENDLAIIQKASKLAADLLYANSYYFLSNRLKYKIEKKELRIKLITQAAINFLKKMLPDFSWQVEDLLCSLPADTIELQQLYIDYFYKTYAAQYDRKQSAFQALLKASKLFFDVNNQLIPFGKEQELIRDVYLLTAQNIKVYVSNVKALTLEDRMLFWQKFIELCQMNGKNPKRIKNCQQLLQVYRNDWLQQNKKQIAESRFLMR